MAKYDIDVDIIGKDGNAFSILGAVKRSLRRAGVDPQEIDKYVKEAVSQDYNHLLATTMEWVNVK